MKPIVFTANVLARTRRLDYYMKITLRNLVVTQGTGWNVFMIISSCALTLTYLDTSGHAAIVKADRQA